MLSKNNRISGILNFVFREKRDSRDYCSERMCFKIFNKRNLYINTIIFIIACILLTSGCNKPETVSSIYDEINVSEYKIRMKQDIFCLMMAYPGFVAGVEQDKNDMVYLVMKSGSKILYDDRKDKNNIEKLNNPDLQDMMEQVYPLNDITTLMPEGFDPGRRRVYKLLREVYGKTREEIKSNLTCISFGYRKYLFNRMNNAASELMSAVLDVISAAKKSIKLYGFLFPSGGTFNYRYIAGTGLLSVHSFGTGIDLATDRKDYWKWATRSQGAQRLEIYPLEIVRIFEKHNFIWGGKWGHFDLMHYEYRPELILKAKYFKKIPEKNEMWYYDVGDLNEDAKRCISIIDSIL